MNRRKNYVLRVISLLSSIVTIYCSVFAQPKLKGTDLVINGESFFAASNITSELTRLARADGVLAPNDSFRQIAVSGASISQILNQYKNCKQKPKYLITDGGGIDMMQRCPSYPPTTDCPIIKNALNTVREYIAEMKKGGTKKFLWMRYPDPYTKKGGINWDTLKANQDVYNPEVEKICKASKDPVCLWVDLRPVWEGHYEEYTYDGIHCTNAGGTATAKAFWEAMKANNWAFFDTTSTSIFDVDFFDNSQLSELPSIYVRDNNLILNAFVQQPSLIGINITTLSGKNIYTTQQKICGSGSQVITLPIKALAKGIYCCEINMENSLSKTTTIVIP